MDDEPRIDALDVQGLRPWLDDPDRPLGELREQLPFLRSDAQARRFIEDIREGLASLGRGEVYTTDEVMRELEARRRARRSAA